mgnify:CR=1 FL=1
MGLDVWTYNVVAVEDVVKKINSCYGSDQLVLSKIWQKSNVRLGDFGFDPLPAFQLLSLSVKVEVSRLEENSDGSGRCIVLFMEFIVFLNQILDVSFSKFDYGIKFTHFFIELIFS